MQTFERDSKKRWLYIMPAVFITYSLAYVDRANYGFGAAAGLADSLHITPSQSALLGSLFFLGYFLFQIPGAAYARRRSARVLIGLALMTWGILASLTGVLHSFWMLAADRLLLGAAESFILPGMLILLTRWFTRGERSRANTLLILGNPVTVLWMSVVTGYMIRAVGWQATFVLEGLPSVVWGVMWFVIIRNKPEDARWMSAESSEQLAAAINAEQVALPAVGGIGNALRNPRVLLLCLQYFLWSVGVYGFVLWLPTIVKQGTSNGIALTGLLSACPYLFAVLLMLVASYFSDRAGSRFRFVWPFLLLSGCAFLGSYFTAAISFWLAYGFLIVACACMYAPYGPFFAIIPEMLPSNVAGEVTALVNSFGALGSFLGSYGVGMLQGMPGGTRTSFMVMGLSLLAAGGIILLLRRITPAAPLRA